MFKKTIVCMLGVMVCVAMLAPTTFAHCGKCGAKKEKPAKKAKGKPIKVELPKPMFRGTPPDLKGKARFDPNAPKKPQPRKPFIAPEGTKVVSDYKPVSASDENPIIGDIDQINDGSKEGTDDCYIEFGPGLQHVQIDLEKEYNIHAILIWHYHGEARVYHDVVVQTADDPDFITNVRTLYNNDHDNSAGLGVGKNYEYVDEYDGLLVDGKGKKARYVRCYSNGNTANDMNHIVEVEVWGKPAK